MLKNGSYGREGQISKGKYNNIMYYTVDPQCNTVTCSLYTRYDKIGIGFSEAIFFSSNTPLDVLSYAHYIGVQFASIGHQYIKFFSRVRIGSVLFLFGVGSLVCWRLWNYWNEAIDDISDNDDEDDAPQGGVRSGKKSFFKNFFNEEFVRNIQDFDGDDPALIQGRYFGPDSPVDCESRDSSTYSPVSSHSSRDPSSKFYQADRSSNEEGSTSASDLEDLPYDNIPPIHRQRKLRRKHKLPKAAQSSSSSSSVSPYNIPHHINSNLHGGAHEKRNHLNERIFPHQGNLYTNSQNIQNTNLPRNIDGLDMVNCENSDKRPYFANYNSEDEWRHDEGMYNNDEELGLPHSRLSRSRTMVNLMGRKMSATPFLTRDNSMPSNLSDYLLSSRGYLRRDDSIASNISDLALSECSEFSLDLRDDSFASQTLSYLMDLEQELDFVKSSVVEMDEDFYKFNSKPNPYLIKTTYDSIDSNSGSRPSSALNFDLYKRRDSDISVDFMDKINLKNYSSNSTAENSLEWDSPQHGWSTTKSSIPRRLYQRRSSSIGGLPRSQSQESGILSLEWDNGGLRKYEEEKVERLSSKDRLGCIQEMKGFEAYKSNCRKYLFLPDHASVELDMEEELRSPSGGAPLISQVNAASTPPINSAPDSLGKRLSQNHLSPSDHKLMTTSIDSAISTTPGSRSGSVSPVSQILSNSMMSSGFGSFYDFSQEVETKFKSRNIETKVETSKENNYDLQHRRKSFQDQYEKQLESQLLSPVPELREKTQFSDKEESDTRSEDSEGEKLRDNIANNNIMGNKNARNKEQTETQTFEAIGSKVRVESYAKKEWAGNTTKANLILKGYQEIPQRLKLNCIRRIRGDNYCAIRSVLFQMLSTSIPFPSSYQTFSKIMSEINRGSTWIRSYNFGCRLPYSKESISTTIKDCLDTLDEIASEIRRLDKKDMALISRLNNNENLDIMLCEAAKLHVLAAIMDLYEKSKNGDLPTFAYILFARETSSCPKDFLINHLNSVGNSAGLEQIEMFLLGYALKVTIQVARPAYYGQEDFICYYPDSHVEEWPRVYLVAEDDRHYNALVS